MSRLALPVVRHLTRDKQNSFGARDLHGLGVSGWVEHALPCKPLNLSCHLISPLYWLYDDVRSRPYPDVKWRTPASCNACHIIADAAESTGLSRSCSSTSRISMVGLPVQLRKTAWASGVASAR